VKQTLAAVAALLAAGCAAQSDRPDNAAALADIQNGRGGREVVVEGTVADVEDTAPGRYGVHEFFILTIASGAARQEVTIADNVSIGEVAPLHDGEDAIVKGVLEIDPSGPVIHWTHHDPEFRHVPGFVEAGGRTYE
jgi:hypothetical protein